MQTGTLQNGQSTRQENSIYLWFGKAFYLSEVVSKNPLRPGSMRCTYQNSIACYIYDLEKLRQFVLVQMYKVIYTDALATDNAYDTIECIRLSWDKHGDREGCLANWKIFHFRPIDSVPGRVHFITGHDRVGILKETVQYKADVLKALGDDS